MSENLIALTSIFPLIMAILYSLPKLNSYKNYFYYLTVFYYVIMISFLNSFDLGIQVLLLFSVTEYLSKRSSENKQNKKSLLNIFIMVGIASAFSFVVYLTFLSSDKLADINLTKNEIGIILISLIFMLLNMGKSKKWNY